MSNPEKTPTSPTPLTLEQKKEEQLLFTQFATKYKAPLRNILGESEEAVQITISNMIQQMINMTNVIQSLSQEIARLKKLCENNKIDHNISVTQIGHNVE